MIKRTIKSNLVDKEEIFNLLALAEVTKLPLLLVGNPGVAKTQVLLDYAAGMYNYDKELTRKNCFIVELDESTKASEIKGRISMEQFLVNKKYTLDTPIADAEYILINEVDKGSSAIRNTMLSVMRERALFMGNEIRKCNWKLYAASCNEIPEDEKTSPFWDRFVLKFKVERVKMTAVTKIWEKKRKDFEVIIPEKQDVDNVTLNSNYLKVFIKTIYTDISDRTASYIPELVKCIKLIWNFTEEEAIIKCCELLCSSKVVQLAKDLEDPALVQVKTKIKSIISLQDINHILSTTKEIENEIKQLETSGYDVKLIEALRKECLKMESKNTVLKEFKDKFQVTNAPIPVEPIDNDIIDVVAEEENSNSF